MILTPNLEPYTGKEPIDIYSQLILWGGLGFIKSD
jgi:hypothetical protein